jgi:hypothetical protein
MFPYLPGQSGYGKRLRKAAGLVRHMIRMLAADTSVWSDDVWVVDSTPVGCGCSRDTATRPELAGWAEYRGTVGSFDFPKRVLLASIYADALAAKGFPVRVLPNLGTRQLVDTALVNGMIPHARHMRDRRRIS